MNHISFSMQYAAGCWYRAAGERTVSPFKRAFYEVETLKHRWLAANAQAIGKLKWINMDAQLPVHQHAGGLLHVRFPVRTTVRR